LPELVVDGFLPEQIWAALELQNGPLMKRLQTRVRKIAEEVRLEAAEAGSEDESEEDLDNEEEMSEGDEEEEIGSDEGEELEDGEEDGDQDEGSDEKDPELEEGASDAVSEEEDSAPHLRRTSGRDTSQVDDDFFRLEEMERFAEEFEKKDIKWAKKTEEDDEDEELEFDLNQDPDAVSDSGDDEDDPEAMKGLFV
jgi:U3 small nucleolar RNA-associated protein MPP10